MSQLIETIKIHNGIPHNIGLHHQRLNRSRKRLFGLSNTIDLQAHLVVPRSFQVGLVKCRVLYDKDIQSISYEKYTIQEVTSLRLVHHDFIDYELKYSNRTLLDQLYAQRGDCDNIIIVKNGQLTDSWYANIVLENQNGALFTPAFPLLKGIKREKLCLDQRIQEVILRPTDLQHFTHIHLINALLDLGTVVVPVEQVRC